MRFFLDENFPKVAHGLLAELGHEVIDVRGSANEGAEDSYIFEMVQQCEAVFLTTDKDFFHTIPYFYTHHHGVVVIALRQPNRKKIMDKLCWFLEHFLEDSLIECVFLLKDRTYAKKIGTTTNDTDLNHYR